jgi:hypothetical protein
MGCYEIKKINWERLNHKCLMVIKERISEGIRGGGGNPGVWDWCWVPEEGGELVHCLFEGIHQLSHQELVSKKYTGGGVRDYIFRMSNVAARLKPIDLAIKDGFLIYLCYRHNLAEPEGGPRTR